MEHLTRRLARTTLLGLALVVGCSSGETSAVPDASADTSGTRFGSSACGSCAAAACATQTTACGADPSCAAYLSCVNGCPVGADGDVDKSCEATCPAVSGSAGETAKRNLTTCWASASCAACGRGGDAGSKHPILSQTCAPSTDPNRCYKCDDEHCCEVLARCRDNPDCVAMRECILGCDAGSLSNACWDKCNAEHPTGAPLFAVRLTCAQVFCGSKDTCGGDEPGSCAACTTASCAEPFVDCYADMDCRALTRCTGACGTDGACFDACRGKSTAAALEKFDALTRCGALNCKAECG